MSKAISKPLGSNDKTHEKYSLISVRFKDVPLEHKVLSFLQ